MLKKILFLGFTLSILIFSNNLSAEINLIVPLKKPVLSKEEIQKKITINILKPLKKPTKTKEIKIEDQFLSWGVIRDRRRADGRILFAMICWFRLPFRKEVRMLRCRI